MGQNIQSAASDVRATKQFEDTEDVRTDMKTTLDRLDLETAGDLTAVFDRFDELEKLVKASLNGTPAGTGLPGPRGAPRSFGLVLELELKREHRVPTSYF